MEDRWCPRCKEARGGHACYDCFYHTLTREELEADGVAGFIEGPWRKALWLNHGCSSNYLYGDDGEMQCNKCMVDFKRMTLDDITMTWARRKLPPLTWDALMKVLGIKKEEDDG